MDEMLAGMSMSEYVHWQAIYDTEPFPEERADRRAARQMINIRHALGERTSLDTKDFITDWWGENLPQQQSPEQMKANMNIIQAANKKSKPPKKPKK